MALAKSTGFRFAASAAEELGEILAKHTQFTPAQCGDIVSRVERALENGRTRSCERPRRGIDEANDVRRLTRIPAMRRRRLLPASARAAVGD